MTEVQIVDVAPGDIAPGDLAQLYASVGWTAYASDPAALAAAVSGSSFVVAALADDDRLVGLARALSDGVTICYLQDILVSPAWQRRGVGRALWDAVAEHYAHVRQLVLLTDDGPGQRAFYEAVGLTEVADMRPHPLRCFARIARV